MKKFIQNLIIGLIAFFGVVSVADALIPVPQGGTGRTIFPLGNLLTGNGQGGLTSTSSPTVGYITATSTSATSLFSGILDVAKKINTSGITGGYYIDNNLILQASSTNFSTTVGQEAGAMIDSTAQLNTAIGYQSMFSNTMGQLNTALGSLSLFTNTMGDANVAVGEFSLAFANSDNNTAIGYQSLFNATGQHNTALGYFAGNGITTGSENVAIGYYSDVASPTGSNQLSIGNLIYGTGLDGTGTTMSSGNIGIGTTTPSYRLGVGGTGAFADNVRASYFVATSTTATSTFAGGLDVGSGGLIYDLSTNNVGIATSSPLQTLTVDGTFGFPNTTSANSGVIYQGGDSLIHNFQHPTGDTAIPEGSNMFMGINAGNFTTGSTATNVIQGSRNLGIGENVMRGMTTGYRNTAIGYNAMSGVNAGNPVFNVAIGAEAMSGTNFEGLRNVAIGYDAMSLCTSCSDNLVMGYNAGFSLTTGLNNMLFGGTAGRQLTTHFNNTAIGVQAMFRVRGSYNIAIGTGALGKNSINGVDVDNNTVIGYDAGGEILTGGDGNIYIGYRAGASNTTGANNFGLGYQVADNITTGSNNFILGNDIDAQSATASNQLSIANIIFGTGIDGTGTTISSGNIGIGTTTPFSKLHISAGANATTTTTIGEIGLSTSKGCVNMNQADGSAGSFYLAGGVMVVENNYCK